MRRVAILIEPSRAFGRGVIEGVSRYSHEQGTWSISFEPRGLEAPPPWFLNWEGDGVLAWFVDTRVAEAVREKDLHYVDIWGSVHPSHVPMIAGDNEAITRMAFEHFRDRGLRHFAFYGLANGYSLYLDHRREAFGRRVVAGGSRCHMLSMTDSDWTPADWEREQARIGDWLQGLPKPVGVMTCYDELGCQVINVCQHIGLRVPEEVAVVGVGDDHVLCELSTPPLTSICHDAPRIGYEAAAWLDLLMRGGETPREPIRIGPRGLVSRRSTDVLAVEDPGVAAAIQYIREHACDGIRVGDVVRQTDVSWSVLEREFKRLLGWNPKDEILRIRIARAERLLAESDLPLKEIARRCGFSGEKYFSDAFCRATHSRPGAYRHLHHRPTFGPRNEDSGRR